MNTKPSDFTSYPLGSVMQNCESETVANNIMKILKRNGDTFRKISFDEYKEERLKDGNFTESEKGYFEKVLNYFVSSDTAKLFSPSWNK